MNWPMFWGCFVGSVVGTWTSYLAQPRLKQLILWHQNRRGIKKMARLFDEIDRRR